MRRGLVHAGAWVLATGSAVTLSWFGVRTVVSEAAYDLPRMPPLTSGTPAPSASRPGPEPETASTRRPRPSSAARSPGVSRPSVSLGSAGARRDAGPGEGAPRAGRASGSVESREVRGGRVAFDLGRDSAGLVSATPSPGWGMRVRQGNGWIRVTFTRGEESSSVFCVWNGTTPRVTVDEHRG
ncbi:hypothetical protein ACGRHY_17745 [Streptomyces sp. HK10]|uniref:hypothetical protein n=1 Tax=Streptomyces sp. HK10 TaxID=3373255 RepID=UPI00374A4801